MKHRLLLVAVFLLAGAVVNVSVAWALTVCVRPGGNNTFAAQSSYESRWSSRPLPSNLHAAQYTHWCVRRTEGIGTVLAAVTAVHGPGPNDAPFEELLPPVARLANELQHFEASSPWDSLGPGFFVWQGRGWPCISMSCSWPWFRVPRRMGGPTPLSPRVDGGISFSPPTRTSPWPFGFHTLRAIPIRPVFPGFAVNTLFYAAVLWLLICGPFALRRFVRVRRGLCPKCAYPMGESAACSECGRLHQPGTMSVVRAGRRSRPAG